MATGIRSFALGMKGMAVISAKAGSG